MAQIQNKKNKNAPVRQGSKVASREPGVKRYSHNSLFAASNEKIILFVLFIYAVLLYANTIGNQYAFDDTVVITGNQYTQQGFKGIPALLTKDLFEGIYGHALEIGGGRWRPLTLVTYAIEVQFFGQNPHISHIINILFYGLLAVLVYRMLRLMVPSMPMVSLTATLLFIAHPIHTEVVANIKSRDEIFSLIGLVVMMIYLFKYAGKFETQNPKSETENSQPSNTKYLIVACVFYFLSLMSKENGITFMIIIPMTLYFFTTLSPKRIFLTTLPFVIIFIGYYLLRTSLVGTVGDQSSNDIMENPFAHSPLGERLATIMSILGKYLLLLFFPTPLSSDYSYNEIPLIGWSSLRALFPFAIYLSMAVYAIIRFRKKDIVAYCILFYLITLSLVSNIFFNIGAPMGERFLFLPSLGFCLAVSYLFLKVLKMEHLKQAGFSSAKMTVPLCIVLILFSIKTISRNPDWKDNLALFKSDVNHVPNSAKVHYYYGNDLYLKATKEKEPGQKHEYLSMAKTETMRSVEINPEFFHAHYNLGLIYQEEGNADSSIYYLRNVFRIEPKHNLTYGAMGIAFGKMKGEFDSAIYYLKTAVLMNPNDEGSLENLGIAYAMKHDLEHAIPNLEKAIALQPTNARVLMNLGVAYDSKGDKEKSQMYFERAFAIDPSLKKK